MSEENKQQSPQHWRIVFGAALIALGIFFLLGQRIDINIWEFSWPIFILLPGLILLALAVTTGGQMGESLAIGGSLLTVLGLLFFYQNTTNHWESWAYAWALVGPTSIGLGQILYGTVKDIDSLVASGRRLTIIGAAIFACGLIFFEFVIGISGFRFGGLGWGLVLIALGLILILLNVRKGRK